jgi:hypothetical protein
MIKRIHRVLVACALASALVCCSVPARGNIPLAVGGQWVASDFFDRAAPDWNLGMGFNVSGIVELGRTTDLRLDWGARWADGEMRPIQNRWHKPSFGGRVGEVYDQIRVMPSTVDLVYRFEDWSRGRYWLPFVGAGVGYYDMQVRRLDSRGEELFNNLYRFGFNARTGLQLHRTSGLFIMAESAVHWVDLPGKRTPLYDVSLGFGTFLHEN